MKKYAIIVAGGKGSRMGMDTPKQFLLLGGKPILMYSIQAFFDYDSELIVVVALPQEYHNYWHELVKEYNFKCLHWLVPGGETRFHSVKNALQFIHEGFRENAIIAIHDAARPLISKEIIERTFDAAERYRVVCPVVPIVDSIREKTKTSSRKVNRDDYCIVQTPQVFYSKYLLNAYEQDYSELFTDDVSVIEASKILKPFLVEGSPENIKITTSTDLAIAETILKCRD